jgi:hypothetical protein
LEEEGVPSDITNAFLQLFDEGNFYPFVPDESIYNAIYWEEEHIEAALGQLAKTCHKRMPESKQERAQIVNSIDSVADFLKSLASLPDAL